MLGLYVYDVMRWVGAGLYFFVFWGCLHASIHISGTYRPALDEDGVALPKNDLGGACRWFQMLGL